MDPFELGARRPARGELLHRAVDAGGTQSRRAPHPRRAGRSGCPRPGIVLGVAGIRADQEHRGTLPSRSDPALPVGSPRTRSGTITGRSRSDHRGGVVRIAAWHGRADVASLAVRGRARSRRRRSSACSTECGRPGTARSSRTRSHRRPPCRSSTPGSRCAAGCASSSTISDTSPTTSAAPGEPARQRSAAPAGNRPRRLRRLLAPRRRRPPPSRAGDAERPSPRRSRAARRLGYGLFGRAGTDGYVQRLAVHPEAQGDGLGRALLVDGLHWLRRRGAVHAYVNTQSDNDRAYALY